MICNTKLMVQSTLFVTENTLFVNQITQNTLFTAFMVTVTDSWQNHNLDNMMILGQLKIGENQANFGGVLTIASASPPPTTNADQNDQLKLFTFSGWVPSQAAPPLWISVAHQFLFALGLLLDCDQTNCISFCQKICCLIFKSNGAPIKQLPWKDKVSEFQFWNGITGQWGGKARHQNSADVSLYLFPANAGEKKATSPFFKRQISNSPPVLFTTGTKKAKTWDKPENIKTLIYLKSTQPKIYR